MIREDGQKTLLFWVGGQWWWWWEEWTLNGENVKIVETR